MSKPWSGKPVNAVVQEYLHRAEKEESRLNLHWFAAVVVELRDKKGWTFRAIAEWFQASGIEADHNAIYRVYREIEVAED